MKDWIDADVKCPFYRMQNKGRRTIGCEGIMAHTTVVHRFRRQEAMDGHLARFCAAKYRECPYFKALMRSKYGG